MNKIFSQRRHLTSKVTTMLRQGIATVLIKKIQFCERTFHGFSIYGHVAKGII